MEYAAPIFVVGMLLGALVMAGAQKLCVAVEKRPPYVDDKQQISDSEYL